MPPSVPPREGEGSSQLSTQNARRDLPFLFPRMPAASASRVRVAIVGGGASGAAAARALSSCSSLSLSLFDQGARGPGGRASHRRVCAHDGRVLADDERPMPLSVAPAASAAPSASVTPAAASTAPATPAAPAAPATPTYEFDHGCQFFRADSEQMVTLVSEWCEAGWAERWDGRFGRICIGEPSADGNEGLSSAAGGSADFFGLPSRTEPVYVGVGGMHQLPRALLSASTASVERGTRVSAVTRTPSGRWSLRVIRGPGALHDTPNAVAHATADVALGEFDVVLLTDASSSLGGWHRASANVDLRTAEAAPPPVDADPRSVTDAVGSSAKAVAATAELERVRRRVRVPLFSAIVALSHPIADPVTGGVPYDAFSLVDCRNDETEGCDGNSTGGRPARSKNPLWFAARSQSKPGFPRDAPECWTLVSTPEYAVAQIESTPMQDSQTGAFRPQEEDYLLSEPGPSLFAAFLEAVSPFLVHAGLALPTAIYMHAQRWGSAIPAPALVGGSDKRGFTTARMEHGDAVCRAVCGIDYTAQLSRLVYERPVATAEHGRAPLCDFLDVGDGLFYAGDFCSHRNPGFEAAVLSGIEAAACIRARFAGVSVDGVAGEEAAGAKWGASPESAFSARRGEHNPVDIAIAREDYSDGAGGTPSAAATTVAAAVRLHDEANLAAQARGVHHGLVLQPAGRRCFRAVPPCVFSTSDGVRLVYQLRIGSKTPLLILGGGQSGRSQACASPAGAEYPAWEGHTVLIFDRTNTGASDVRYRTANAEVDDQVDDLVQLLDHLASIGTVRGHWILVGHSSGGRLLGRLAFRRPDLVKAVAFLVLTGGRAAAAGLAEQYYLRYTLAALSPGGMHEVLLKPHYAELARNNEHSRHRLGNMPPADFARAMEASAQMFALTKDEPALGLPATQLRQLGDRLSLFVCNYFGEGTHDGMHTAEVSRAVACAAGGSCELVISRDQAVWATALINFVRRHTSTELLA